MILQTRENKADGDPRRLSEAFFKEAGENLRGIVAMVDTIPSAALYVKDAEGRFMAANRRNLDICGFAREEDVLGLTSADIFPEPLAREYIALDRQVRETGRPVVMTTKSPTGDFSTDKLVKSVFPVFAEGRGAVRRGRGRAVPRCIGTVCVYVQTPSAEETPQWHGRLRRVTAWIAANPGEKMSVAALARRAGMRPKQLEAVFQAVLGTSVMGFVATQRLAAARRLLETTDASVSEIAAECGYFDHSHFTKAFARKWGCAPGAYRKRSSGLAAAFRRRSGAG